MALSGREKATIFLSILGSDISSQVLRYLSPEVGDLIAAGLNHLPSPSPEALSSVLEEFSSLAALPSAESKTISPPPVFSMPPQVESIKPPQPRREGIDSLFYAPPQKISYVLAHERPELLAFVLSHFPPMQRVEIISYLPVEKSKIEELVNRIRSDYLSDKIRDRLFKVITRRLANL